MFRRVLTIHITEYMAELWFVKSKTAIFLPVFWQFIYKITCPGTFCAKRVTWMSGKHIKPKYHTGSQVLVHASIYLQLPSELLWWEFEFASVSYALFISPFPFQSRLFKRSSSSFSISTSASSLISWSNPKRCNKPWIYKKNKYELLPPIQNKCDLRFLHRD